jgi:hypothetical protein
MRRFYLNKNLMFLTNIEKIYYLFLHESNYMTSLTVQEGVLQIYSTYKIQI